MSVHPKILDTRSGIATPVCTDCGEMFARSVNEISDRRGTGMPPSSRCPACREARRAERNARVLASLRAGIGRETRPAAVGPVDSAERLYPAVCAACQRAIRLPFKPSLDRSVYCRFCHEARSGR